MARWGELFRLLLLSYPPRGEVTTAVDEETVFEELVVLRRRRCGDMSVEKEEAKVPIMCDVRVEVDGGLGIVVSNKSCCRLA